MVSLAKGLGSGSGGWWGGSFPVENKRKRGRGERGCGGGGGQAKEPASQCTSFVETTLGTV